MKRFKRHQEKNIEKVREGEEGETYMNTDKRFRHIDTYTYNYTYTFQYIQKQENKNFF